MSVQSLNAQSGASEADAPAIEAPISVKQWIGGFWVVVFLAWVAWQVLSNPGFEWGVVGDYIFHPRILSGVVMTLQLTVLVMVIGTVVGILVAVMRMSNDRISQFWALGFVWFFRGTPVLVQLVFWFNLAALFPTIAFGIPFGGPKLFEIDSTTAITALTAAALGLGLNEGAYMAEIVRGGLLSVNRGQVEASKALGYRPYHTFFHVILPQAMTSIVPPTGNQVIGVLKYTSLASVVGTYELMHSVESIYARNYQTIPLLIVAALWYLFLVSLLSVVQYFIERHYARGSNHISMGA